MFLELGKQSKKKTGERDGEKEVFKQHENEGVKKEMLHFVPNNLGDAVQKQFTLLVILPLSWCQPRSGSS